MRVFVTGASGYIGNAVARAFRLHGHEVFGLIRSEKYSQQLLQEEIIPVLGDLQFPEKWESVLDKTGVIAHCAFDMSQQGVEKDEKVLNFLINYASNAETPRTLLYTSGCWVYGNTGDCIADDATPLNPIDLVKWRVEQEKRLLNAECKNLRPLVMRPGCVYGGKGGLTGLWFESAKLGEVNMVENGENRWAMIHINDLGNAYVLAAEKRLSGIALNIVNNDHSKVKDMVTAVAKSMGIGATIKILSEAEAAKQYGAFVEGLLLNQQIQHDYTGLLLGWQPRYPNFIEGIETYLASWRAS